MSARPRPRLCIEVVHRGQVRCSVTSRGTYQQGPRSQGVGTPQKLDQNPFSWIVRRVRANPDVVPWLVFDEAGRAVEPVRRYLIDRRPVQPALTGAVWTAKMDHRPGEPKRGHGRQGGAQCGSATPAVCRAELTAHSDDASPHGVLASPAHSAWSIRALAAFSCSSMCSLVSPRASDMETTALRRPSSVTPLRVM